MTEQSKSDGQQPDKTGSVLGRALARRQGNAVVQKARPRPAIATEFQPDVVEVEDKSPDRFARYVLYSLLTMMGLAILWAGLAEVDRVVSAPGEITTDTPHVVLQPLETSIIRQVHVSSGSVVKEGEVLVTLDPTFTGADLADLQARERSYGAEAARLEAELNDVKLDLQTDSSADQQLQSTLFERRRANHLAQLESFDQEIRRQETLVTTSGDEIRSLTERLAIASKIVEMRATLEKKEVGSALNRMIAENDRLSLSAALEKARNSRIEAEAALASTTARREAYLQQWRQQIATELVENRRRAAEVNEQLRKAQLRNSRIILTAPMDGVILELADKTIGAVVDKDDALVTLVPTAAPLEVEAKVPVTEIGFIVPGQPVRIKLSAYPFQKHGTADGVLRWVSDDTFADRQRPEIRFYKAKVEITKTDLRNLPENFRLIPGMTTTAEIKVGERSVLSYFLYPIMGTLDEAIRDPRL